MFPFDVEDEDEELTEEEENDIPSDYEIDFTTGRLTGRVVTGLDAIIQWVKIVLSTDRYCFPQYTWDHGNELNTLIGKAYDKAYIQSEAKRMIEEAIMIDENILGIEDLECSMEKDRLNIHFSISTIYGRGEISV